MSVCPLCSCVQTRKARYAIFKVVNDKDAPLEILLEKQGDRKTSKEESESHHCSANARTDQIGVQ